MGAWFGETWGYTILLSVVYGAAVGYIAKELLHWAEERHYVDRESFLVFAITLAVSSFRPPNLSVNYACTPFVPFYSVLTWKTKRLTHLFSTAISSRNYGYGGLG